MWKNTQATISKNQIEIEHRGYDPYKYPSGGTRYYYEFEYFIDGKRYAGNFCSRATIREMKLCFNDVSSPSIINIEYNSENPNKYKIPLLKKYRRKSLVRGILFFILLVLGTYGLIKLIILFS